MDDQEEGSNFSLKMRQVMSESCIEVTDADIRRALSVMDAIKEQFLEAVGEGGSLAILPEDEQALSSGALSMLMVGLIQTRAFPQGTVVVSSEGQGVALVLSRTVLDVYRTGVYAIYAAHQRLCSLRDEAEMMSKEGQGFISHDYILTMQEVAEDSKSKAEMLRGIVNTFHEMMSPRLSNLASEDHPDALWERFSKGEVAQNARICVISSDDLDEDDDMDNVATHEPHRTVQ